jgi:hypothetical protein
MVSSSVGLRADSERCKIQISPLVREGALHNDTSKCQIKGNLKSSHGPQRAARHQDILAD